MLEQTYRYITTTQGIRSGRAIVQGRRIAVHDVAGLVVNGASIDDVVKSFPALTRAQVYSCMAYYEDHKDEMDLLIARQLEGRTNTADLSKEIQCSVQKEDTGT